MFAKLLKILLLATIQPCEETLHILIPTDVFRGEVLSCPDIIHETICIPNKLDRNGITVTSNERKYWTAGVQVPITLIIMLNLDRGTNKTNMFKSREIYLLTQQQLKSS